MVREIMELLIFHSNYLNQSELCVALEATHSKFLLHRSEKVDQGGVTYLSFILHHYTTGCQLRSIF
jgi:hypothetical protein